MNINREIAILNLQLLDRVQMAMDSEPYLIKPECRTVAQEKIDRTRADTAKQGCPSRRPSIFTVSSQEVSRGSSRRNWNPRILTPCGLKGQCNFLADSLTATVRIPERMSNHNHRFVSETQRADSFNKSHKCLDTLPSLFVTLGNIDTCEGCTSLVGTMLHTQ